ncbi:MAG TPA: hypothetical protein VGL25_02705, partial [Casimicrobiaceae bacterium]
CGSRGAESASRLQRLSEIHRRGIASALRFAVRSDNVGRVIDEAERLVQHGHRVCRMSGRKLGLDVDEKLSQPYFVGFSYFKLGDEPVDLGLRVVGF